MTHSRCFTLNSTPFKASSGGVKIVGFLRPSACWKKGPLSVQIRSLNSRFYSVSAGFGRRRSRVARSWFLDQNQKAVFACRRSLTRGMGLAVDRGMLTDGGLWFRELFYLEQWQEAELPAEVGSVPPGWIPESSWKFSECERRAWASAYRGAIDDHRWHGIVPLATEDAEMGSIRQGCFPYGLPPGVKYRKMLKLSREKAWRWACRRRNESVFGRVRFSRKTDRVMVLRDRSHCGISMRCPAFVDSRGEKWTVTLPSAPAKPVSAKGFGWDSLVRKFADTFRRWRCRAGKR